MLRYLSFLPTALLISNFPRPHSQNGRQDAPSRWPLLVGLLLLSLSALSCPAAAQPSPTFVPHFELQAGNSALAITAEDFNGDSLVDLAIAMPSYPVQVFFGDGEGGFTTALTSGSHGGTAIASGDFNGDGRRDVVIADAATSIQLVLGNGDEGLSGTTFVPSNAAFAGVAVADLNDDAKQDVVGANASSSSVTIFLGNGNTTFQPPQEFPIGGLPRALWVGDLNADGNIDAVASVNTGDVAVLMGNGTGSFNTPTRYPAGRLPTGLAVGDFNHDGNLDIVVANNGLNTVSVLLGNGDGTFQPRFQVVTGSATYSVRLADFNHDGTCDIVTSNPYTNAVSILLGRGDGSVVFRQDLPVGAQPFGLVAADFNRDGRLDVATANFGSNNVSVLIDAGCPAIVSVRDVPNDQGGRVAVSWRFPLDRPPHRVVTGYRVWRGVTGRTVATTMGISSRDGIAESFWEPIAELPAAQLGSYGYTAATTQDSVAASNPLTAFFVQALTADPAVFYNSSPDSGYSVDNLAPPMPTPFVASYSSKSNQLHWGRNAAADFREFRLYRGYAPNFMPSPANLILASADTAYTDAPGAAYYKLVSVDVHNNVSRTALVTPMSPTATLVALVSSKLEDGVAHFVWYSGQALEPPVRLYRRVGSSSWQGVAQLVQDGTGFLRYEDRVDAGVQYQYRLGLSVDGVESFFGDATIYRGLAELAISAIEPNPSSGTTLKVALVLGSRAPAVLEIFDLHGRRVAGQSVNSLEGGPRVARLEVGFLVSGTYLLRLTQGAEARTAKFIRVL